MRQMTRRAALFGAVGLGGLMTLRGDELDPLFAPAPAGQAQPMEYRQGKIERFDQITLGNVVNIGGSLFTDLPVLGVAEASSLRAGSVVGVMCVGETWAIIGRLVTPNTAEALDAITLVGQGIYSASVAALEGCTSSGAFVDLTTPGPSVTAEIKASGKALVVVGALCAGSGTSPTALMDFAISGASTRSPVSTTALAIDTSTSTVLALLAASRANLVTGLNAGFNIFTAKYASGSPPGATANFQNRNITVFAL